NYMGVRSKAIDAMIAAMLKATDRADFVAAVRALDRMLMSGFYVVPLFYLPDQWVARWAYIRRPDKTSLSGYLPEAWWRAPARRGGGRDDEPRMPHGHPPPRPPPGVGRVGRPPTDEFFRRPAARRPDAIALADPPNRAAVTDGAPRRLTFAEADRMISAVALRLRRLGLGADPIVGLQMANTVHALLTLPPILPPPLPPMPPPPL